MKKPNILLVDDEVDFIQTLAERLQLRGFDIHIAHDGDSAMGQMEASPPPDIVVLDVMMPGLGGLEVLKQIKSQLPKIQVILLTGRGSTAEGIEGMRLGAFDYLMKPIDIDELIKKINESIRSPS